ncbi:MAG: TRAP transporter substrate-binding protein [Desulfobacula sp.]|jgi:TRAP-type C4-dicarboxylate transport system substrate-binding protein|uniref:TRAP transporter substrate-binding protein n=3 Tax=Desulfobacula sp. TaxID=2593537 RepID=UPI001E035AC6|nr:TRAP transporter substrate-binding protein [Deltaproteobacteria bacterium]MBT4025881.1 TRAP transporter substrate-binding protein [Desulfobacula sp.]MBT4878082.1 TRAP transporter substrate-binding protein [Desulfobacula sp.]MBT5545515.1 TRAP transporter substrate-binding protein [Desulfobacula sp.]MBT5970496.1 TRAP transporter substrate-binding protein [Desulfobacula sp.]
MKRSNFFCVTLCLFVSLLLVMVGLNCAVAEEGSLTFATTTPPKSNHEIAAQKFVEAVAQRTGGKINIKHFGAGSLYNAKSIMAAMSKNQIDIGLLHVALVGRRSPVLEFVGSFGAMGCWESYEHYYRFLDNPRTREIASAEFAKYFNGRLLSAWSFGTSLLGCRDKAITTIEDFKGLKMRTSGTAMATMYKALGVVPISLSSKEIYTGLQRGTIQGAGSGVSRWRRSKLYEVAPYLTVDPTIPYFSMWLVINQKSWDKLSSSDQKIIADTAKEYEAWTRDYAAKEREEDFAFLKSEAKAFVELSKEQKAKLVNTVKPVMKAFAKDQLGDQYQELWGLLEASK